MDSSPVRIRQREVRGAWVLYGIWITEFGACITDNGIILITVLGVVGGAVWHDLMGFGGTSGH